MTIPTSSRPIVGLTLALLATLTAPALAASATCFDYGHVDHSTAGCMAHWPLDDVTGSATPDVSGGGFDAAVYGPVLVGSPLCQALDFDGLDDFVDTQFVPFLNPGDSISFSIHAKMPLTIPGSKEALIGLEVGGAQQITVRILHSGETNPGHIFFYLRDDGYAQSWVTSQNNMCDGGWHHIVAVRDGTTGQLLLYIDGVLDSSAPDSSTSTINSSGLTLYIGANNHWSGMYYDGSLDDLAIFSRAINLQEARLLANDVNGNCAADYWDAFDNSGPWADLGQALPGTNGIPSLTGQGPLIEGMQVCLQLKNTLPSGTTNLVLGLSLLQAPFKCGVLVPSLDSIFFGLPIDSLGQYSLCAVWPAGFAPGSTIYAQHWIVDSGGCAGFAASNAVSATVP